MQCPTIKYFYLSFGIGFLKKYIKYFSIIVEKNEKYIFLMNFQPIFFNFQLALDSIDLYQ
jgi:hypothetical protein